MLNLILLVGMVFNVAMVYVKYWILHGQYFRWTNLLAMGQSLDFIILPLIWLILNDGTNSCTDYGSFLFLMPIMGLLLCVNYAWGRYYAKKLEYARTVQQFLEDEGSEEGDGERQGESCGKASSSDVNTGVEADDEGSSLQSSTEN